jgi:hypothetical protein
MTKLSANEKSENMLREGSGLIQTHHVGISLSLGQNLKRDFPILINVNYQTAT